MSTVPQGEAAPPLRVVLAAEGLRFSWPGMPRPCIDIEALRIPLPSTDEQDAIVDVVWSRLRAADKAIDAVDRQIDLLIEHRQALITAAVTGELAIPALAA